MGGGGRVIAGVTESSDVDLSGMPEALRGMGELVNLRRVGGGVVEGGAARGTRRSSVLPSASSMVVGRTATVAAAAAGRPVRMAEMMVFTDGADWERGSDVVDIMVGSEDEFEELDDDEFDIQHRFRVVDWRRGSSTSNP
jgi:hypothetical protein